MFADHLPFDLGEIVVEIPEALLREIAGARADGEATRPPRLSLDGHSLGHWDVMEIDVQFRGRPHYLARLRRRTGC